MEVAHKFPCVHGVGRKHRIVPSSNGCLRYADDTQTLGFDNKPTSEPPYLDKFPLLLIDDECDDASVDTGVQEFSESGEPDPDYCPKTINALIRKLLNFFHRRAYIGYTATPQANTFIHHEGRTDTHGMDLYPKNQQN